MKNIFTKTIILFLISFIFTLNPNEASGQSKLQKIKDKVTSLVNKIRRRAPRQTVAIERTDPIVENGPTVNPFSPDVPRLSAEAEFLSDQLIYNAEAFNIIDQIWRNRMFTAESENASGNHKILVTQLRKEFPQLRIEKNLSLEEYTLLHEIFHRGDTPLSERHILKLNEFVAHPRINIVGDRTRFEDDRDHESRID